MSTDEPLTYKDAEELVLAHLSERETLVLVGGQALNYWCSRYFPVAEELRPFAPFASKDIDFQGTRADVEWCAQRIKGSEVKYPTIDDATPVSGKILFRDARGQKHQIDFLPTPYGLRPQQVRESSVPLLIPATDGREIRLLVMSPPVCLRSRVHNVIGLPGYYDNPDGMKQLQASIVCAREFSREAAFSQNVRLALDSNEYVFKFALNHDHAKKLLKRKGIDVLEAVAHGDGFPEKFNDVRYPQMQERLAKKRGVPIPLRRR